MARLSYAYDSPAFSYDFSQRITGKERDQESGLDYFGARYYGSNMGRFMSPDWSENQDPVPYADLENPQSLNLYSYVNNNPLSKADKSGHVPCGGNASITINVNSNGTSSMSQSADDCPNLGWWDTWRFNFANNAAMNATRHLPPPQNPSRNEGLQDINNLMMGLVPVPEVGAQPRRLRELFGTDGAGKIKGNPVEQAKQALERLKETKELPKGLNESDLDAYQKVIDRAPNTTNPNQALQSTRQEIVNTAREILKNK